MGIAERKEREKNRRQNEILDAAEEVFFDKGLRQATMDEVAEKAELAKATLYLYFKNKESLYQGISLRAMSVLQKKFEEAVDRVENSGDKLMAIGQAYIEFALEYPYYFQTMSFVENMHLGDKAYDPEDEASRQCHETGHSILEFIAKIVEQGQRDGYLRDELRPFNTAVLLWASGNGIIQMHQTKGQHFSELHGFEQDFLLKEYLNFCNLAMFKKPALRY